MSSHRRFRRAFEALCALGFANDEAFVLALRYSVEF